MSRCEKNDKLDEEIKLAGVESLVPEELEKHLILNSNRLRTFEDPRLEVVTYVKAKFGLTGAHGHSDLMDVDAFNSLSCLAQEKDETATHAQAQASNRMAKANRASHGP